MPSAVPYHVYFYHDNMLEGHVVETGRLNSFDNLPKMKKRSYIIPNKYRKIQIQVIYLIRSVLLYMILGELLIELGFLLLEWKLII